MTATCFLFLVMRKNNLRRAHPLTRICSFRTAQTQLLPLPQGARVTTQTIEAHVPSPRGSFMLYFQVCSYITLL